VANIADVQITEEAFERPRNFDLAAHWEKSSRAYEAGVWRGQADIRLSPWMRCTIPVESEAHGVRELMRLCGDVEVLGPPSLREKFAATLGAMARRHRIRPERSA
jgi:predicted DNA-binding transcriptional regulator YafY